MYYCCVQRRHYGCYFELLSFCQLEQLQIRKCEYIFVSEILIRCDVLTVVKLQKRWFFGIPAYRCTIFYRFHRQTDRPKKHIWWNRKMNESVSVNAPLLQSKRSIFSIFLCKWERKPHKFWNASSKDNRNQVRAWIIIWGRTNWIELNWIETLSQSYRKHFIYDIKIISYTFIFDSMWLLLPYAFRFFVSLIGAASAVYVGFSPCFLFVPFIFNSYSSGCKFRWNRSNKKKWK